MTQRKRSSRKTVGVTLLVDDHALGDLDRIVRSATRAGLRTPEVLTALGVITGRANPDVVAEFADIPGVKSAEAERTFQLPPPDKPQ